jgi:ABC-type protease/lipase transport system fused ATPase/permease subunit
MTKKPLGEAAGYSQKSSQLATSHLHNAETIQAMGMLGALRKRWFGVHSRFLGLQNQASDTGAVISSISKTLRLCLQSLVLGLGALLVIKGDMTAGMMIAGSILMGRVLSPIDQLIAVWKQWSGAKLAYRRLDALLQAFPPSDEAMALPAPKARLPLSKSVPAHRGNARRPCTWSTSRLARAKCWACSVLPGPASRPWPSAGRRVADPGWHGAPGRCRHPSLEPR